MDKIKAIFDLMASAKAYVGTIAALGGLMVTLGANSDFQQLVPETTTGKVAAIGSLLVTFAAIFAPTNRKTAAQAAEDLRKARAREAKPPTTRRRRKPAKKAAAKRSPKPPGAAGTP